MDGEEKYSDYDVTNMGFQDVHSVDVEKYELLDHNIEHPRKLRNLSL